jgi:hypothetical protein
VHTTWHQLTHLQVASGKWQVASGKWQVAICNLPNTALGTMRGVFNKRTAHTCPRIGGNGSVSQFNQPLQARGQTHTTSNATYAVLLSPVLYVSPLATLILSWNPAPWLVAVQYRSLNPQPEG